MIDTNAIRCKILDLAIQGCLNDASAEDASLLVEQLSDKKEELIKAKIIGKEKPYTDVTDEEKLFEIPNNWVWVRLGQICAQVIDGTHKTPKYQENGIPFLSVKNISSGVFDLSDIKYISPEEHTELIKRCKPELNDVLVCRIGTLGKAIKVNIDFDFSIFVSLGLIKPVIEDLSDYIVSVINSGYGTDWIRDNKAGGAMHTYKINLGSLRMLPIPLPPLSEQLIINRKTKVLFACLNDIDSMQEDYSRNVSVLKTKVVEASISGKFIDSHSSRKEVDGLFEEIEKKHEELIKKKVIKKDKKLPEIKQEETPFDIPSTWKWVYMGDLFQHNTGKALNSSDKQGVLLEYITTSNMYWDRFELDDLKKMHFKEDEVDKCTIKKGDLLICEGGDIGRSSIWPFDEEMRIQNHIHRLRGFIPEKICVKYYYYLMWLYKQNGLINGRGIGLQGFSSKRLHSLIVPFPPFKEQEKIAESIEELLFYCK